MALVLAAAVFGTDLDRPSKLTSIAPEQVNLMSRRLEEAQIWDGDQVSTEKWTPYSGGVSLGLLAHGMVASGKLERMIGNGEITYRRQSNLEVALVCTGRK